MTTVYTEPAEADASDVHDRVATLAGTSLLVTGSPMVGKGRFLERTIRAALDDERDVIHVTASRGYDRVASFLPTRTAVVDCSPEPAPTRPGVRDVASPSDLTGISIPVSELLQRARDRPVVTFDSVTTLLVYADETSVFRFLSVLTGQLRQADGLGLFLLEEGCHDRQTVSTFQQLFDGRVDVDRERARVRGVAGVSSDWTGR